MYWEHLMPKISIFGCLSNIQMLIHTLFKGALVGTDSLGNKYYRGRPRKKGTARDRRWVIYNGALEASTVPPEWHGWLHHQTDDVPGEHSKYRKDWQKPPVANMTGTKMAYLPPGHPSKGGKRAAATGDYTPWQPPR